MVKNFLSLIILGLIVSSCKYFKSDPTPENPIDFVGLSTSDTLFEKHYKISHQPGIYSKPFYLSIAADTNCAIFYTMNGSKPQPGSKDTKIYGKAIQLTEKGAFNNKFYNIPTSAGGDRTYYKWKKPTHCRLGYSIIVQAYIGDSAISKPCAYSYFIQEKSHHSFPIMALTANPKKLWSDEDGILVPGNNVDTTRNARSGNYYMNWQIPCNVEYFSNQGKRLFANQFAMKIHGLNSPLAPQKSLRLYAKKKLGTPYFPRLLFPDDTITKQKRIVLRTLFSAWHGYLNADAIISKIAQKFNVDCANSTPITLYINGEYWGIENLRERIDKHYIAQHYSLNPDSIDIVLDNQQTKAGTSDSYAVLCNFIQSNDLRIDSIYNYVINQFDKESLMDYFILQTFFNNIDWPSNNHVLWKSQKPNSKWRYLLYDLDATWRHSQTKSLANAIVKHDTKTVDQETLVFSSLLKNKEFKTEFIEYYKLVMKTKLKKENVIAVINEFEQQYAYDLLEHISRWQYPNSLDFWYEKNEAMRTFAQEREGYVLEELEALEKSDTYPL
ncbi:MAG: CotH kinase family protein [Crocinitomicaceae bacterium]